MLSEIVNEIEMNVNNNCTSKAHVSIFNCNYFAARQSRAHLIDFDQIESVGCK